MEAILALNTLDRDTFLKYANELGFDKMSAEKFLFIVQKSDIDVYPLMCEERINILLYVWELCDSYLQVQRNKKNIDVLKSIIKMIVPYSLNIWFSEEWKCSRALFRLALLSCLNRSKELLKMYFHTIHWDYWLNLGVSPYNVNYLQNLNLVMERIKQNKEKELNTLETVEEIATDEDIEYIKQEQLPLILLRLIKLFDTKTMEVVKALAMRVLAAWNELYCHRNHRPQNVSLEDKRCLILICHVYLMAVYELDTVCGYIIDNMMNNIRFYYEGFQMEISTSNTINTSTTENLVYTPALYIALTCFRLGLKKREFFESFIWHSYDNHTVTLFDVVSQAYKSYLIGNVLMELNLLNEEDFITYLPLYRNLMKRYIMVRENSEKFILNEMRKKEAQYYAHNKVQTVKFMTDFKSKICKGNRMSNIGNYENLDKQNVNKKDDYMTNESNDLKLDPVFQYIPDNENVLYFVYNLLASRSYKGWHFAKIVLLLKIIRNELNGIDTWRYHPGLTIDFMLNLETKLSRHYEDLAKIFEEHPFLEQEFWLTAFYLNPTNRLYEHVVRCGTRFNRRIRDEQPRTNFVTMNSNYSNINSNINVNNSSIGNISNISIGMNVNTNTNSCNNIKFGLLSSTIEVKHIVDLSNFESLDMDYEPLFKALRSLRLSESMVKDILTVVFLPRIKTLAWVVNWPELRKRCKTLLKDNKEKRRFVELNMAEANEHLKFLKVDYDKYKNRPQLDYGTIEEGYENNIHASDYNDESDNADEYDGFGYGHGDIYGDGGGEGECFEDFEDDEDDYETPGNKDATQKQKSNLRDQLFDLKDEYLLGKRRTRARTAAAFAEAMSTFEKSLQGANIVTDNHNPESSPVKSIEKTNTSDNNDNKHKVVDNVVKKNIKELLSECPVILDTPDGFKPVVDIWKIDNNLSKIIDNSSIYLSETEHILGKFNKLVSLKLLVKPERIEQDNSEINDTDSNVFCHNQKENHFNSYHEIKDVDAQLIDRNKLVTNQRNLTEEKRNTDTSCGNVNNLGKISLYEMKEPVVALVNIQHKLKKHNERIIINDNNKNDKHWTNIIKKNSCYENCQANHEYSENRTDNQEETLLLQLKQSCFKRQLSVRLQTLTVKDLKNLRQPRVLLKRLKMEYHASTVAPINKRRKVTEFLFFDTDGDDDNDDDDSNYNSHCRTETKKKTMRKRKRSIIESSDYSISDEYKPRKKHLSSRSIRNKQLFKTMKSSTVPFSTVLTATATTDTVTSCQSNSNLVVTPRSASGLKLRISQMQQLEEQQQRSTDTDTDESVTSVVDVIQLSSTSSYDVEDVGNEIVVPRSLMPVSELIELCTDPLYEEEIII